jgi:hypothetical protein
VCVCVCVRAGGRAFIYTGGAIKYAHFKKGKNCIKIVMVLRSSNDNRASAIFFDCPACRMVTLAFI